MKGIRFIPEQTQINFLGMRFIAFVLSVFLTIGAIYFIASKGLSLGVDFTGGTLVEVRVPVTPDLSDLRTRLNDLDLGSVSIQEFGHPQDLLIRMQEQEGGPEAQTAAIEKVRNELDVIYKNSGATVDNQTLSTEGDVSDSGVEYRRTEFVGPQVGEELKQQGLLAIIASIVGIMAYVWFRFEWQFGVTALIALAHDALLTVGLFALTQMEFNLSTVAAILMVAGYSINDTVVVFDRIRENMRKFKKMPLEDLLNMTVNQTLSRTIMTSLTTLLALIALYVFGGEVIRGFVVALIFGIVVGTYSSIYVASPILTLLGVRETTNKTEEEPQTAS